MKKSLPCLTALASLISASGALAQAALPLPTGSTQVPVASAANAETEQFQPGNRLLMQAAAQLDRHTSVSAKLRHQIAIAGAQLFGVGSYWQQGSGEELKMRLELQIAGQEATLR